MSTTDQVSKGKPCARLTLVFLRPSSTIPDVTSWQNTCLAALSCLEFAINIQMPTSAQLHLQSAGTALLVSTTANRAQEVETDMTVSSNSAPVRMLGLGSSNNLSHCTL